MATPGHGFHPLKAQQFRSIPNLQDVPRQGRTPYRRPILARRITPNSDFDWSACRYTTHVNRSALTRAETITSMLVGWFSCRRME